MIDWLHCMDLGVVGADFAGNLLFHVLPSFPGSTMKQQCQALLHRHLQAFYRENPVTSNKLTTLTPLMIQKKNAKGKLTSPKLRASAGELRSLVPWLLHCSVHIGRHQNFGQYDLAATQHLVSMYSCLSRDDYSPAALAAHCRKFMLLYVELEKHAPAGLWKMKPKFHMAQELCEFDLVNPSLTWVYRDEDYGGSLAKTSKHRGGFNTPSVISRIHSPSLFLAILCPHGLCSEKDWKWLPLGKGGDLLCRRNGISRVGDMTYLLCRRKNMNPVQEK